MKIFSRFKQAGFSTVEAIIGIGLLGVVASIGVWQADLAKNSSTELAFDRGLVEMLAGLESFVTSPEVCEKNFLGQTIKKTYTELVDGEGDTIYKQGPFGQVKPKAGRDPEDFYWKHPALQNQALLQGELYIQSMKTYLEGDNVVLELDFKRGKGAKKAFTRKIELMVDTESGTISECFNPTQSILDTVQMLVAKRICEKTYGVETPLFFAHFNEENASCSFDGYPAANLNNKCPEGQSISSITYNSTTLELQYHCSQLIAKMDCPTGWMKSIKTTGQSECQPLPLDTSFSTMALPANCGLIVTSGNKIKLNCIGTTGGTTTGGPTTYTNYRCDTNSESWHTNGTCTELSPKCFDSGNATHNETRCCSVQPSAACMSSPTTYTNFKCDTSSESWVNNGTCTTLSSNCSDSEVASHNETRCCSSSPSAACKEIEEPTEKVCVHAFKNFACCDTGKVGMWYTCVAIDTSPGDYYGDVCTKDSDCLSTNAIINPGITVSCHNPSIRPPKMLEQRVYNIQGTCKDI